MAQAATAGEIVVDAVRRTFGDRTVLNDTSFRVAAGEVVAIVGASGAGKSTILELICGLQRPDAGTVTADRAVLMPQHDALFPWLDAAANAALPLRLAGVPHREAAQQGAALLGQLGLADFAAARTWELSGGMRQRVAVARTLLSGAPILCLDEPFGALDAITRAETQRWFAGVLAQTPRTTVLVTHDVEEAALLGDRVLVLSPRPGTIIAELTVGSPRGPDGRSPTETAVLETRAAALDALRETAAA